MKRQGQPSQGRRRGANFPIRMTEVERAALLAKQQEVGGPRGLGPWLIWRALEGESPARAMPGPGPGNAQAAQAMPAQLPCIDGAMPVPACRAAAGQCPAGNAPSMARRLILDLCAGSGSWSEPYLQAGYPVERVTLPDGDVRTYVPPPSVWGVLCAPPCTEFSMAKNSYGHDFIRGMETVNACLRIVLQARPMWWALENPAGHLSKFLGRPTDTWEPYHFGDPWTKRTCTWGEHQIPRRGPFVSPTGSAMDRPTAAARAITPPGFARSFFEANP